MHVWSSWGIGVAVIDVSNLRGNIGLLVRRSGWSLQCGMNVGPLCILFGVHFIRFITLVPFASLKSLVDLAYFLHSITTRASLDFLRGRRKVSPER